MAALRILVLLGVTLVGLVLVAGQTDKQEEVDGVNVKIHGRSGKISIWRKPKRGNSTVDEKDHTSFEFDDLSETDSAGKVIGTRGRVKHSFKSFASQDFTFEAPDDVTIPDSEVTARRIRFGGSLKGLSSTLKAVVYLAKEAGNVTAGDEEQELVKGSVKFNIELSNWEWCGQQDTACGETGEFIDVVLTLKSHGAPKMKEGDGPPPNKDKGPPGSDVTGMPPKGKKRKARKWDLGAKTDLQLSDKVNIDGVWKDMPEGYPKIETRGSKQSIVLRFPKFNNKAVYDPVLTEGDNEEGDAGGASTLVASLTGLLVGVLVAFGGH